MRERKRKGLYFSEKEKHPIRRWRTDLETNFCDTCEEEGFILLPYKSCYYSNKKKLGWAGKRVLIRPLTQVKEETTKVKEREQVKHQFLKVSPHTCEEKGPYCCYLKSVTIVGKRARIS